VTGAVDGNSDRLYPPTVALAQDAAVAEGVHPAKHVCCVFSSDAQLTALSAEFLRLGLAAGNRLLYVADRPDEGALLADLADLGDVGGLAERGALLVQPVRDAYTKNEVVDPAAQVEAYRRLTEAAVADGFTGLCVAADATALVTGRNARRAFMAYELAVDQFMATAPMQAMCAYDVRVLKRAVLDLVCVHRHQRVPAGVRPGFTMWPGHDGVGVSGEVDVSNAERFRDALDAAVDALSTTAASEMRRRLRIDAADLAFIDAEGTSALVAFSEQAAPDGRIEVADPPRSLRAIVETLGWRERLAFVHREATA